MNETFGCSFSPGDNIKAMIRPFLKTAKGEILLTMYCLEEPDLIADLIAASKRGVTVKVILDHQQECLHAKLGILQNLRNHSITVHVIAGVSGHIMHNKYCIIDQVTLLTGSFNWTPDALVYNEENYLWIKDQFLIQAYNDNFNSLWLRPSYL